MWGWMAFHYHIDGGNPTLTLMTESRRKSIRSKRLWSENQVGHAEGNIGNGKRLSALECVPLTISPGIDDKIPSPAGRGPG